MICNPAYKRGESVDRPLRVESSQVEMKVKKDCAPRIWKRTRSNGDGRGCC